MSGVQLIRPTGVGGSRTTPGSLATHGLGGGIDENVRPSLGTGGIIGASMAKIPSTTTAEIRDLVRQKQDELLQIHETRVREAELRASAKEAEVEELQRRLAKIREDFQYNLRLLEDRDEELRRYDTVIENLKALVGERETQIEEMRTETEAELGRVRQKADAAEARDETLKKKVDSLTREMEDMEKKHERALADMRKEYERRLSGLQARIDEEEKAKVEESARLASIYERAAQEKELAIQVAKDAHAQTEKALQEKANRALADLSALRVALTARDEAASSLEKALREMEKEAEKRKREQEEERKEKESEMKGIRRELEEMRGMKLRLINEHESAVAQLVGKIKMLERKARVDSAKYAADSEAWQERFSQAAAQRHEHLEEVRKQLEVLRGKHRQEVDELRRGLISAKRTTEETVVKMKAEEKERMERMERALSDAEMEGKKAKDEARRWESEVRVMNAKVNANEEAVREAQRRVDHVMSEVAQAREDAARAMKERDEVERARMSEVGRLGRDVERAQAEVASARSMLESCNAETARLRGEISMLCIIVM